MSIRRKPGDIVWLEPNSGFVGESWKLKAEIMPEENPPPCFECDDPECVEWSNLKTMPDKNGKQYFLCHVSECHMYDKQQIPEKDLK